MPQKAEKDVEVEVVDLDGNGDVDLVVSSLTTPSGGICRANIAEGAGRWSEADAAKHYKIARGEAMECAASVDVLKLRKLIDQPSYERGISLRQGVVAMLTKMF